MFEEKESVSCDCLIVRPDATLTISRTAEWRLAPAAVNLAVSSRHAVAESAVGDRHRKRQVRAAGVRADGPECSVPILCAEIRDRGLVQPDRYGTGRSGAPADHF